jgi:hypothetical protein
MELKETRYENVGRIKRLMTGCSGELLWTRKLISGSIKGELSWSGEQQSGSQGRHFLWNWNRMKLLVSETLDVSSCPSFKASLFTWLCAPCL